MDTHTPVLIVGAGPAGLSAALSLGRLGIPCILVERRARVGSHPRATGVRTRTMELLRGWGLEDAVRRAGLRTLGAGDFAFRATLAGEEYGVVEIAHDEESMRFRRSVSPTMVTFCPQDVLEPILLDAVRAIPCVDIRFSTELRDLEVTDDAAFGLLVSEDAPPVRVRADYLLACDGARSGIRRTLGIQLEDSGLAVDFVNTEFQADLSPWIGDRPAILYWIMNSASSGVFVTLEGQRRWLFTALQAVDESAVTDEWCTRIVREAVGVADLPVEIVTSRAWRMTAEVAQRFREGRVFLVGDAAHRFPPTGGFGMNSSVQDAHNLAWKVAAVCAGWAEDALLDTYETERKPIAEFNSRQSAENLFLMAELGFGPGVYEFAARVEKGGAEGEALRAQIRQAIPRQIHQFDGIGQDLGFGYAEGAVISDGSNGPALRDPSHFQPHGTPGFRAPHHLLARGREEISTLDLFGDGFVLMAAPRDRGWTVAAEKAAEARGIPLRAYRIGTEGGPVVDPAGTWCDVVGVGAEGAILVRPDGHVAWRTRAAATDAAAAVLADVLGTLAGPSGVAADGERRP